MSKNLFWKLFFIVFLTGMCLLSMLPFEMKLKSGLDISGGTAVVYQINTQGMDKNQRMNVAEQMIRILKQRIDPTNKLNLVWRAQGNDRIEIQMPMATEATRAKRKEYQKILDGLTKYNISLRTVRYELNWPKMADKSDQERSEILAAFKAKRDESFAKLAGDSPERLANLTTLATAFDAHNAARDKRDALLLTQKEKQSQFETAKIGLMAADNLASRWDNLDDPNQAKELEQIAGKDAAKQTMVRDYITIRKELSAVRKTINNDVNGLKAQEDRAWADLRDANINLDQFVQYLSVTSSKRDDAVTAMKNKYPQAKEEIDKIIQAYDDYTRVAGRLDDPEDLMRRLRGSGVLEFRIVPRRNEQGLTESEIAEYTERLASFGPITASDKGHSGYVWRKIRTPEEFSVENPIVAPYGEDQYVLLHNTPEETLKHEVGEESWSLTDAYVTSDQYGAPAVGFEFNMIGANKFLNLTKKNLQRPLCILLDEEAISAPNIQSAISERGSISGRFTLQEVQDLADKLNAGSLPARLGDQPISINTVGPTVGKNNLEAGKNAGMIGLVLVMIFMACYYLIPGGLAGIALGLNMILIIGFMAFTRATFTLPGIAALILTIGMAVDANVLIFERIREEQARGSSLRISLQNGYSRAFRTILDANLTTFIVALILWVLATEEIKGFALMLMIGIASSMFTALFVTHVIFDLLLDLNLLKNKLKMVNLIGHPKFNWMSKRLIFRVVSGAVVVICIAIFTLRDEDANSKYSIEFTGGTDVHVMLTEEGAKELQAKTGMADLRGAIEKAVRDEGKLKNNKAISAVTVQQVGPDENREFSIITTATNLEHVTITQDKPIITREALEKAIRNAAEEIGDRRLAKAVVLAGATENTFTMETDQLNLNLINEVLEKALPEGVTAGKAKTDPIVTDAVGNALAGKLNAKISLKPVDIVSKPITDELIEKKPYLEPFKGGLWISCHFDGGKADTIAKIRARFEDARFGSDFEKYTYHEPTLFTLANKRLTEAEENTLLLNGIEMASISQEIVYGASSDQEWDGFVANELGRFTDTLNLQTTFERLSQIDPSIGHQSMNQALIAIVFSLLAIIGYIWIRFGDVRFGLAAVAALVHDVSIAIGLVAASYWLSTTMIGKALLISDFKIDLPMIAGFLTVIGYSLNDTIVVFDRIRENRGKLAILSASVIDSSINQTISRTLITSMTTLMVLIVMYIWGGPNLRGFNYVLIVGIVVGTYSSIGIAAPLLYGATVEEPKPVEPVVENEGVSL
ncbi:MAG: protein translocase subunit SecD [Phycisphaerae bacterium]|nr:protein translocase subunit SecD [Phycisphaerae bacterium]